MDAQLASSLAELSSSLCESLERNEHFVAVVDECVSKRILVKDGKQTCTPSEKDLSALVNYVDAVDANVAYLGKICRTDIGHLASELKFLSNMCNAKLDAVMTAVEVLRRTLQSEELAMDVGGRSSVGNLASTPRPPVAP